MMDSSYPTLPERQPKRSYPLSIRLTEAERTQVEALARRLKLPDSFLARHFILEAVNHHSAIQLEETAVET